MEEHENIFILKEKPVTGRQATKDKSKLNQNVYSVSKSFAFYMISFNSIKMFVF